MTRPDYCPVAQEPCQSMCVFSDVRCKIMREGKDFTISKIWVGLTDEEKRQILLDDSIDWINAIEAKLREKNDG